MRSTQLEYQTNMSNDRLGIPVHTPIRRTMNSGRVGDIGFFKRDGSCGWIGGAFVQTFYLELILKNTVIQDWLESSLPEEEAVKDVLLKMNMRFQIAIGRQVKIECNMTDKAQE